MHSREYERNKKEKGAQKERSKTYLPKKKNANEQVQMQRMWTPQCVFGTQETCIEITLNINLNVKDNKPTPI